MSDVAVIALALALIGAAGTAVALALRNGQLTADITACKAASGTAEKQLSVTASEFADYKRRTDAQLEAARRDVEELQHDLEACATPGAQRARLGQLLGKLAPRAPTAGGGSGTGPVPALAAAERGAGDQPGRTG